MYIDKLGEIVNKYNNTYHRTIKIKPADVNLSMYFDFNKVNNKVGPKFKVGDRVRKSKYKNIFAKGYVPNWSEKVFVISKVMLLVILKTKKFLERFMKNNCKKQIKKSLELK